MIDWACLHIHVKYDGIAQINTYRETPEKCHGLLINTYMGP